MYRILFICLGNICRSPMAEFVMKKLVSTSSIADKVSIDSKATSNEEYGNPPHPGCLAKLREKNVPYTSHRSTKLQKSDYDEYDLIVGMEDSNIRNILRIVQQDPDGKVKKLLDFADGGNIDDPWYTGDFSTTYTDVLYGCQALLAHLEKTLG